MGFRTRLVTGPIEKTYSNDQRWVTYLSTTANEYTQLDIIYKNFNRYTAYQL